MLLEASRFQTTNISKAAATRCVLLWILKTRLIMQNNYGIIKLFFATVLRVILSPKYDHLYLFCVNVNNFEEGVLS